MVTKKNEKIEHPREGGPGVRGIHWPQKKKRSEKIEHPREGGPGVRGIHWPQKKSGVKN